MTTDNLKLCAEQAFKQMGLGFTRESVERDSILAIALQNPIISEQDGSRGNNLLDSHRDLFTEYYFYHEFMFYWFSAVELEAEFSFLSKIKRLCELDLGPLQFDAQSILSEMQNYAFLISVTRMKAVGVVAEHQPQQFENWYYERIASLRRLQQDAVQMGIQSGPVAENWQIGLTPRTTPYHDYLGAFSDAMVEAIGRADDLTFTAAFETAILMKRGFMFERMQEILVDGLTKLGAW